jgi:radical SAM superfamily enzyme YgiQ (UPF0313 family)
MLDFPPRIPYCAAVMDGHARRGGARALLVYPRFSGTSFWNYRDTCALMGASYPAPPLGLITVAALFPPDWEVRLVDRNVGEVLSDDDLRWADLVMTGGMLPQRVDALAIMARAHALGRPVVVGGPDATSAPAAYAEADFRVLGEAEELVPQLVEQWRGGARCGLFTASRFPDMSLSPLPRFDLLKLDRYLHVGVQFSRGCPFGCEFCNVIELNGRAPRSKSPAQMLRELDALYRLGYRGHVDIVDDNLIGARKAVKPFLRELAAWVRARGHPFEFTTEASLDLADDEQLLALMAKANFFAVFVGIETPDPVALTAANKGQNVHRAIAESVRKIHRAGIFVNAGFILGFDAERGEAADAMVRCIEATGIPVCMVGLLFALPGTKLAERLRAEGRLEDPMREYTDDEADQCTSGLNFRTVRPRQEILRDYREILRRIYEPASYFGRARRVGRELDRHEHVLRPPLRNVWRDVRAFGRMAWRMGLADPSTRGEWWRLVADALVHNPRSLKIALSFAALYLHLGPYSRALIQRLDRAIAREELQRA